jgi:hypothetical protein
MQWTSLVVGVCIALAVGVAAARQRKRGQTFAQQVLPLLHTRGPLSLPELEQALGIKGLIARGKIVTALNELITQKQVTVIEAPQGTPQLQKVNFIRYQARP